MTVGKDERRHLNFLLKAGPGPSLEKSRRLLPLCAAAHSVSSKRLWLCLYTKKMRTSCKRGQADLTGPSESAKAIPRSKQSWAGREKCACPF